MAQHDSDDAFVGRVFAVYDTLNNVFYVGAFAIGVLIVPRDGHGLAAVLLICGAYLVAAVGYGVAGRRLDTSSALIGGRTG